MNKTAISWTSASWNPTFGCHKISAGCAHCYAETIALRMGHAKKPWTAANAAENVVLKPHKLREPYKLKTPSRIFVNSMSDLFHEQIPDAYLAQVFKVMCDLPQHTFQVLTKRPERAAAWAGPWPAHIWMGTSIEDRKALTRLDVLRQCPAPVRFVSFEPLLEDLGTVDLTGYHWAICGGESGPGFRVMPHSWARSLRDQCLAQDVSYFFKQSSAPKTEYGTSLRNEDGTFWTWQQFPDNRTAPVQAQPHRWAID